MTHGVYLQQDKKKLSATVAILRHYRAFLRSDASLMRDPQDAFARVLEKAEAQRRLSNWVDVAINRKAGVPDAFRSELGGAHQADEIVRQARRIVRDDPELRVSIGHFTPPMRRVLRRVLDEITSPAAAAINSKEKAMEYDKTAVIVMPNLPEYGITDKVTCGILSHQGEMPESVKPIQGALSRIASRLNVELNQPSAVLVKSFQQAIERRANAAKLEPSNSAGLTLG